MNLNAHVLRLCQIREKMDRGEELSEREVAYVRALRERLKPVLARLKESLERASGMDIHSLAARLEVEAARRQKERLRHEARMRRWEEGWR
jgi:hypothetical protein